jgi:peptidyl-prolyl cis-trans isomerase C
MQRMNLALALSVSLALCACTKATGNESAEVVIAKVGDDKITLADIQTEAPGVAAGSVDPGLVTRLVNRKLLAQAARDEKLDDAAAKRSGALATEIALANAKGKKIADAVTAPTAAEIDAFIAAQPQAFAARKFIVIEQIELARPTKPLAIAPSQGVTSLDQVQAVLDAAGVPYQRTVVVVDTANAPAAVNQRLLAMPANSLFELSTGAVIAEGQIVQVRSVPLSGPRAREIASNYLKNQKIGAAVLKATADLRKAKADKIKLENGYTEAN